MNAYARYVARNGYPRRTRGPLPRLGAYVDILESLPYWRKHYLRQRRAGYKLQFTEYGWMLSLAMNPAALPDRRDAA